MDCKGITNAPADVTSDDERNKIALNDAPCMRYIVVVVVSQKDSRLKRNQSQFFFFTRLSLLHHVRKLNDRIPHRGANSKIKDNQIPAVAVLEEILQLKCWMAKSINEIV